MKKIIIIHKFLPQYRKEFFIKLKEDLLKKDIELELIYGRRKNANALIKDEIDLEWAQYIPNKIIKIGNIELIWQPCLKYLKNKDLVIVESANKLLLNYYLIFARYYSKYKLAFWGHGRNLQENISSFRNQFKYIFTKKCDWWFGYTQGTKKILLTQGYPENKITVVQNAINTLELRKFYNDIEDVEIHHLINKLRIRNCKTAIYCGAMYPGKNLDFIIESCFRIKKEIPEFNMIFIGTGEEAYKVKEASDTYEWIHYVGSKFGNERVKYFKISLIQLMPFYVGLGILDSFAMETPLVTTSNPTHGPEIEYIEDGVNGLVSKDTIDEYSLTVINALKTGSYLNLIEGCEKSSKIYNIENMVENFTNGVISCLDINS